jgi:acetyltransferase-like isoleucine patch superfamily enzyme
MSGTFVHGTATVEEGAVLGEGTKVWHCAHVREGARLGRNCIVGHCAYVGKDVRVGDNVKIQNKATLYKGVSVEDDVFVGPHVAFSNDLEPRSVGDFKIVPTVVKKGASIGVNSTVICGVTIGEYAMVGGGSVVTRDVPAHGLVYGNPASLRGFVCSCGKDLGKGEQKDGAVSIRCGSCGKTCVIPAGVYAKLVK